MQPFLMATWHMQVGQQRLQLRREPARNPGRGTPGAAAAPLHALTPELSTLRPGNTPRAGGTTTAPTLS
eukprot:233586-Chlamydomonas_euryale.AAC.1